MALFLALLAIVQSPVELEVDLRAPQEVVAGLPVVVKYTLRNSSPTALSPDRGTNRGEWLSLQVLDSRKEVMAESEPEPTRPSGTALLDLTLGAGRAFEDRLAVRFETTDLAPGLYTFRYRIDLRVPDMKPAIRSGEARRFRKTVDVPTQVRRDPAAVTAHAAALIDRIVGLPDSSVDKAEALRELSLIDPKVTMPLLRNVPFVPASSVPSSPILVQGQRKADN